MLQNLKRFVVFYGMLLVLIGLDRWLFGISSLFSQGSYCAIAPDVLRQMAMGQRLCGLLMDLVSNGLFVSVLYFLYRVIQNIQTDKTFAKDTLIYISRMSKFYIFYAVFTPFYGVAFSVITTMHHRPGQRVLSVSFGIENLNQILVACCLYVIFKVMKEAHRVSSEYGMVI